MPLSARRDDPALDTLARELYELFPACVQCSEPIACFEDAAVLVHLHRLAHRGGCRPESRPPQRTADPDPLSTG